MATTQLGHPPVKEIMVIDVQPRPRRPHWFERYGQPCVAELLGAALFIFIGCLSVVEQSEGTGRLQPALAHGLALAIVVAVLGEISGGHFNPAVSLAVWLVGGLDITMLLPYWVAQLCGGMVGAGLAKAALGDDRYLSSSGGAFGTITEDGQIPTALATEIVLSALLLLVVCMGAVNGSTRTPLAPFCVGLAVTVGVLAGGSLSGGCMNPARAFGPAVVASHWDYHWVYWVGPIAAALLVSLLVRLLMGDRTTRLFLK